MPAQSVLQKTLRTRDLRTSVAGVASGQTGGLEEDGIWDAIHLLFIVSFVRVVRV